MSSPSKRGRDDVPKTATGIVEDDVPTPPEVKEQAPKRARVEPDSSVSGGGASVIGGVGGGGDGKSGGRFRSSWTAGEDARLAEVMQEVTANGSRPKLKWIHIAERMGSEVKRTGKQCRERWLNHLDPNIRKGGWSLKEDVTIFGEQRKVGNRWAHIARMLPGRSADDVKNRFHSAHARRRMNDHISNGTLPVTAGIMEPVGDRFDGPNPPLALLGSSAKDAAGSARAGGQPSGMYRLMYVPVHIESLGAVASVGGIPHPSPPVIAPIPGASATGAPTSSAISAVSASQKSDAATAVAAATSLTTPATSSGVTAPPPTDAPATSTTTSAGQAFGERSGYGMMTSMMPMHMAAALQGQGALGPMSASAAAHLSHGIIMPPPSMMGFVPYGSMPPSSTGLAPGDAPPMPWHPAQGSRQAWSSGPSTAGVPPTAAAVPTSASSAYGQPPITTAATATSHAPTPAEPSSSDRQTRV